MDAQQDNGQFQRNFFEEKLETYDNIGLGSVS